MKLILLELNEINFEIVSSYINSGHLLPGFKNIINGDGIFFETSSEKEYELLEPWIQWASVHNGMTYDEHKIFRLGDAVNFNYDQIFEKVEKAGYSVGAISAMNAVNNMSNPAYFIPDPWTKTEPDNSFLSKALSSALSQAVNDNSSSRITIKSLFFLAISFFYLVNFKSWFSMGRYALGAIRKPWKKALFLDKFLYEIHLTLLKTKKPNFSTLFLNAGAHIQHHYFHNSNQLNTKFKNPSWYIEDSEDPVLEMLKVYDLMIHDLINNEDYSLIIATGLSQKPYKHNKFYYRLSDHERFLDLLNIKYKEVHTRMTRDFLIKFNNRDETKLAKEKLSTVLVENNTKLFGEIDDRGNELFVVVTYPKEVKIDTCFEYEGISRKLMKFVDFVAIKNGEHQEKGYAFFSSTLKDIAISNNDHVSKIHEVISKFFKLDKSL